MPAETATPTGKGARLYRFSAEAPDELPLDELPEEELLELDVPPDELLDEELLEDELLLEPDELLLLEPPEDEPPPSHRLPVSWGISTVPPAVP